MISNPVGMLRENVLPFFSVTRCGTSLYWAVMAKEENRMSPINSAFMRFVLFVLSGGNATVKERAVGRPTGTLVHTRVSARDPI